jgi:protein-disulfide isomerase
VSTARQIDQTYVKTGQVKIVSKNLAVHGEQAVKMAEAALCAGDQGRFWDYHDSQLEALYTGRLTAVDPAALKARAADLGLAAAAFAACLDGGKHTQRVQDEGEEASARGVTGTPTFFIDDVKLVGAQPFATFKTAIDNALKK